MSNLIIYTTDDGATKIDLRLENGTTGNACRSQMAEVILNHDLAGLVRAVSAGTKPQPKVANRAMTALKRAT